MVRYNRDTRGNIYTFSFPTDAAYEEAVRREHIVKLGAHGTLQFRPVQRRPANEEFFIYGLTGVGSAKDYMVPQIACNMWECRRTWCGQAWHRGCGMGLGH